MRELNSLSRTTVQYPHLMSRIEKYLTQLSFCKIFCNNGVSCWTHRIAVLRSLHLGSRHIRRFPLVFLQWSPWWTFVMIPCNCCTMLSSSFLISSFRPSGMRLGGWITGATLGSSVIWYSPWTRSIPLRQWGYSLSKLLCPVCETRVVVMCYWVFQQNSSEILASGRKRLADQYDCPPRCLSDLELCCCCDSVVCTLNVATMPGLLTIPRIPSVWCLICRVCQALGHHLIGCFGGNIALYVLNGKMLACAPESILPLRSTHEPLRCGSFSSIITRASSVVAALERLSTVMGSKWSSSNCWSRSTLVVRWWTGRFWRASRVFYCSVLAALSLSL